MLCRAFQPSLFLCLPQVGLVFGCLDSVCMFARTGRANSRYEKVIITRPPPPPESAVSKAPLRNRWPLAQPWPLGVQAFAFPQAFRVFQARPA